MKLRRLLLPMKDPQNESEAGRHARVGAMEGFVPAEAFAGAKPGYDFKTGARGCGYYAQLELDPEPGPEPEPEPEPRVEATSSSWAAPEDQQFDLESVPALSAEEIQAQESAEQERVAKHVALVRELCDDDVIKAIFTQFDNDMDGRLDMTEYGSYLKAISYSKAWTEAQWAKECNMIGTDAGTGVKIKNMQFLYTKFRSKKLRIDYANVFKLPGDEVRQIIDSERRRLGALSGSTDVAAAIGGESQLLTASDMAQSGLSVEEYKTMQGMLGGSKAKGTKVLAKLVGEIVSLASDAFDANQTLVLMACTNCTVTVDATCAKVFVNSCTGCTVKLNGKVITHTLEAYKSSDCVFDIQHKIWTAQMVILFLCAAVPIFDVAAMQRLQ